MFSDSSYIRIQSLKREAPGLLMVGNISTKSVQSWQGRASAMAVELEIMQTARWTLARSPPGTTVGGW